MQHLLNSTLAFYIHRFRSATDQPRQEHQPQQKREHMMVTSCSTSSTSTAAGTGNSRAAKNLNRVDLPRPFGPSRPYRFPAASRKSASLSSSRFTCVFGRVSNANTKAALFQGGRGEGTMKQGSNTLSQSRDIKVSYLRTQAKPLNRQSRWYRTRGIVGHFTPYAKAGS